MQKIIEKILANTRTIKVVLLGVMFVSLFATSGFALPALQSQLNNICGTAKGILGVGIMLMIVLAGVIYAVGQVMGAETRARATVWGTAMLLGALIAAIIYVIVPPILQAILNSNGPGGNITLSC
jgi:hypothetical protein